MKASVRIMLICCFAAIFVAAACGRSNFEARVQQAEALMDSAPDSALAIAESLRPDSRAERARTALLLTKARYKAYVPLTDDSLIALAADFYAGHNDSLETQALFFLGETYRTLSNYGEAIIFAQEAEEIAHKCNDYFYEGQSQRLLADIYRLNYDFDNELMYRKKSITSYEKAGKTDYIIWEKVFLASALGSSGHNKDAINYLRDIIKDTIGTNKYLKHEYLRSKSSSDFALGRYSEVIANYENQTDRSLMSSKDWNLLAMSQCVQGMNREAFSSIDSAKQVIDDNEDFCSVLFAEAQLLYREGQVKKAFQLLSFSDSIQNKLRDSLLVHPYNSLIADIYRLKYTQKQTEKRYLKVINILTIALSVLLIAILGYIIISYRKKSKIQEYKIFSLKTDIKELLTTIEETRRSKEIIDKKTFGLNSLRSLINEMSYIISTSSAKNIENKSRFKELLFELASEQSIKSLADLVNRLYNGALDDVYIKIPRLNKRQEQILIFSALGFSSNTICLLTNINDSKTLDQARWRLRETIKSRLGDLSGNVLKMLDTRSK